MPKRSAAHIKKINDDFQKGIRTKKPKPKEKKKTEEEGGLNPYVVGFLMFVVIGSGFFAILKNFF
eukprot:CAMPEP_0201564752 /NCGR_PEP_ID=MMETSP0190_2-20130828/3292_1 /ASSEMBLY_ACC=CAM_ASM_000263 /TAXON_ID=37353 /ORGANISM="Rosalina sp." /LENGTH=64 /DNA_ID=CAMNT_0047981343 /DNA_START=51 /DNA_END=245 /DNA_ORIENTATION=+